MRYTPLRAPEAAPVVPEPLDSELWLARTFLDEVATANVHSNADMIQAAAGLDYRLRALLAALDAADRWQCPHCDTWNTDRRDPKRCLCCDKRR